jgi:hypothetical protein
MLLSLTKGNQSKSFVFLMIYAFYKLRMELPICSWLWFLLVFINSWFSSPSLWIFSLLFLFIKNKGMLMISPCCVWVSLCLYVYPQHQPSKTWASLYETWYVYQGTWAHLNGVRHKSLPSVCVCICVYPPIFRRQRLGKHVPAQRRIF